MSGNIIELIKEPTMKIRQLLSCYGSPLIDLVIRLWIARIFFNSGLTKINDWENTVFLFEFEYAVPILPPEIAAFFATVFELGMPILLVLGLFTRLSAIPLLAMSLVIQFVLGANNAAYDNIEHYYWMILLLVIIIKGPGMISLDRLICKKFCGGEK
ncbi:DoxX family protein [Curvivirga aplysinae]|uniref:DoxX family protein n=1 Tax=Curvivirga aplysinae TaxID=2529852 RepID=UPI0012BD3890|nr:DoxX family protein [Curvivirga aplysinae]MTI08765.1 DoxX family protein [Curvivirga aplysinae]